MVNQFDFFFFFSLWKWIVLRNSLDLALRCCLAIRSVASFSRFSIASRFSFFFLLFSLLSLHHSFAVFYLSQEFLFTPFSLHLPRISLTSPLSAFPSYKVFWPFPPFSGIPSPLQLFTCTCPSTSSPSPPPPSYFIVPPLSTTFLSSQNIHKNFPASASTTYLAPRPWPVSLHRLSQLLCHIACNPPSPNIVCCLFVYFSVRSSIYSSIH